MVQDCAIFARDGWKSLCSPALAQRSCSSEKEGALPVRLFATHLKVPYLGEATNLPQKSGILS